MLLLGEIRVAAAGAVGEKFMPALHGPYPESFQVWIHQVWAPAERVVGGVTEQVPPLHTADASYHFLKILPDALLIHR
jgi:hypothetical protein